MALTPLVLSPVLPADLLSYIVTKYSYPTTIIICCSRADFAAALVNDVHDQVTADITGDADGSQSPGSAPELFNPSAIAAMRLLSAPVYQVAVARHIRMVFIPTVSHLRAYLSVFSIEDSKVLAPPAQVPATTDSGSSRKTSPLLVVYGFLGLHRDTSEWSAQGLSSSAAGLVETAKRLGFQPAIVEPGSHEVDDDFEGQLGKVLPVLSGSTRKFGPDMEDLGWTGRTVDLRRVLGRWFRFQDGEWRGDKRAKSPQLNVQGEVNTGSFMAQ